MSFGNLAELETERTLVRLFREGDTEAIGTISDPAVILIDNPAGLISVNQSHHHRFMGVWLKSGVLIGCINFQLFDNCDVRLGFWLMPTMQRQGYAYESISAVLQVLSEAYPDKKLCAETSNDNIRALRLLERLGFTRTDRETKTERSVVLCR